MKTFIYSNFANTLTIARLVISPIVIPLLLVTTIPKQDLWLNMLLMVFFLALSLTDFLDGYIARNYQQESPIGKLLDPVADKMLVFSTLIALVQVQKLYFYWTIIIIGREFFVMGLREIALHYGFTVPVSMIGKIKTCMQIAYIAFVILNPAQQLAWQAPFWNGTEMILLIIALGFTIASGLTYYLRFSIALNTSQYP